MRVATLLGSFPVVSETFILDQLTGLLDLGHEVDVFAERREDGPRVHASVERYGLAERAHYVEMPDASGFWELPARPLRGETWVPGAAEPIPNLRRVLDAAPVFARCLARAPGHTLSVLDRDEYGYQADSLSSLYRLGALAGHRRGYDVAHAHFGPVGDRFRFTRGLWRAPLVVSFHGYDYTSWPREHGADVYERLFAVADVVTVNSDYARARLEELGCPGERIERLPYGVDLDGFAFRERAAGDGPLRVLTVARLVAKKGVEDAIRAVARARGEGVALHYDVVGDGPLAEPLRELVGELGLGDAVTLHGAQDRSVVQRLMAAADVFLLPSVTAPDGDMEGTPVSLLEAQACGIPVVSTRHSGIPEIVGDEATGLLVDEHDVAALAGRLGRLARDPALRARLGRAGRERMEREHDQRALVARLVEVYTEAAAKRSAGLGVTNLQ